MSDLEHRTRSALQQFDNNMAGIFDRSTFYDNDLYTTKSSDPTLTKSQKCFKYTLFIANIIFSIFGIILISVGAYALNNQLGVVSGTTLPAGIVVMGVFILLLALLGSIAAYKESRGFLGLYFVILLILTIILFAVGIAVTAEKSNASSYISSGYKAAFNGSQSSQSIVVTTQNAFSCCGLNKFADQYTIYPCLGYNNATSVPDTLRSTYNAYCLPQLTNAFDSAMGAAGGCGIAFAIIMICGLAFVCVLMQGIKRKRLETDLAALRQSNAINEDYDGAQIL